MQPNLTLLDGAMGTELTRRGIDTHLPLWSARALIDCPKVVQQIHQDYAAAGAHVLTTNTFRTNRRTLDRAGLGHRMRELTHTAVQLARNATTSAMRVAGSLAPVEDCYTPDLVPEDAALRDEHNELAHYLAEAGCNLLLVETMNTIREAVAATQAAAQTGLPMWVSFTLNEDSDLVSGESLVDAIKAITPFQPSAILVNCIPVAQVSRALGLLQQYVPTHVRFGAYANVGHVDDEVGWTLTHAVTPEQYRKAAQDWLALGASIIGGCCGTMPAHIEALAATV